jgi:cyclase
MTGRTLAPLSAGADIVDDEAIEAEVVEIAERIYAYLQPNGGWCLNNAGLVVGPRGTVLIDTAATELRGRRLEQAVRELSPRPVDVLVNTHSHGDHTFGNQFFAEESTIVAHHRAAAEMAEFGLVLQGLWPDVRWGDIQLQLPSITYTDRLSLPDLGIRVELLHLGPGHTGGDTVVWLPDQRVLFAGDVVFSQTTPFVLMGSVIGSLRLLDRLRALRPLVVIPGHGPVGGPELLDENADYLQWIRGLSRIGTAERISPLELARTIELGRYAGWADSERLVCNLIRGYAEQDGLEPAGQLDVAGAFEQMIEFNGGRPRCHA